MYRPDYNKKFKEVPQCGQSVCLHVCCAPCSAGVWERLSGFAVYPYYYNPNIDTIGEYYVRLLQFSKLGLSVRPQFYDHAEFMHAVRGLENEPEGGLRCRVCIAMRLRKTAEYAAARGFDYFCSTLSVSPHKNAAYINSVGEALAAEYGVAWLYNDFKKENGFARSVQVSRDKSLYRQDYCGCEFGRARIAK